MPSIINATTTNGVAISPDNSGSLQLATNNGTTAVTIDTSQNLLVGTNTQVAGAKLTLSGSATLGSTYQQVITDGTRAVRLGANSTSAEIQSTGGVPLYLNYGGNDVVIVPQGSGNVGIGTSSPARRLTVKGSTGIAAERDIDTDRMIVTYNNINCYANANGAGNHNNFTFSQSNNTETVERMRITSGGNQLTGTTTDPDTNKTGCLANRGVFSHAGYSGAYASNVFNFQWTGSARIWVDTTDLGTVQFSSDYRIKRNIETQTAPALERIMQLRPVTYQMADYGNLFKASDDVKEGFIAHEVQEVIPSGADGEKDAENQIQSLRVDSILSVAVKAIQELKAELDEVKAELAVMKGTE